MATYTEFYNLDLYESTDRPNLRDQYNGAMGKIDSAMHDMAGDISTATATATSAATAAANATTAAADAATVAANAATAASDAATVAGNAATAAGDATTAAANANTKAEAALGLAGAGDIIVIGDSFSAGGEWTTKLSQKTGRTVHNYAISGAGFIAGSNFLGQLQTAINTGIEGVSDVIVYGGVNDWYSSQSSAGVITAISQFADAVTAASPSLRLHICFCNLGFAQQQQYNGFSNWYSAVMRGVRDLGVRGLIDFVPLWHMNRPSMFATDNAHPNATGYSVIASYMSDILSGTYTGVDVLQIFPLMHGGVNMGTQFVHFVNGVVYVGLRASSTITWTNVQDFSFLSICTIGNGASQYSLMIGNGGTDSSWYYAPLTTFATSAGSMCIIRPLFNAQNMGAYFHAFGDAGQLNNRTYDWSGENISWTVMPVQN